MSMLYWLLRGKLYEADDRRLEYNPLHINMPHLLCIIQMCTFKVCFLCGSFRDANFHFSEQRSHLVRNLPLSRKNETLLRWIVLLIGYFHNTGNLFCVIGNHKFLSVGVLDCLSLSIKQQNTFLFVKNPSSVLFFQFTSFRIIPNF